VGSVCLYVSFRNIGLGMSDELTTQKHLPIESLVWRGNLPLTTAVSETLLCKNDFVLGQGAGGKGSLTSARVSMLLGNISTKHVTYIYS
jgi:hypothetical protein